MTWLSLAGRNVRQNARNYAAFFLSSTFTVWMFFLYGSLLFHPQFSGEAVQAEVRRSMYVLEAVVAFFAVFFILHSFSAFLRARKRELGLLTLLGATPGQITCLLVVENLLIGAGATAAGVLLGVISSKLFFLGFGKVMQMEAVFAFHFAPEAALLTVAVFGLIFGLITLAARHSMRRSSVLDLLKASVKGKRAPRFSPWAAAAAAASLALAFWLGLTATMENVVGRLLPGFGLLSFGTYLLCFHGGTAVLRVLQRWRPLYWRKTNLVIIAQLVFRIRENARTLFAISLLAGIALALASMSLAGTVKARELAEQFVPVAMQVTGASAQPVDRIIAEERLAVTGSAHQRVLKGALMLPGEAAPSEVAVMARSGFDQWVRNVTHGAPLPAPPGAEAGVLVPATPGMSRPSATSVTVRFGEQAAEIPILGHPFTPTFNIGFVAYVLVLDDAAFTNWEARYGEQFGLDVHGYAVADWQATLDLSRLLQREYGVDTSTKFGTFRGAAFTATVLYLNDAKVSNSLSLFLSCFVALLFFLASGHMLYFKLFADLGEDREQMRMLHRLGMGEREVGRIISVQTFLLFFLPLVFAAAFASLGMAVIHAVLGVAIWEQGVTVTGIYALFQAGYYLVTRRTYVRFLHLAA